MNSENAQIPLVPLALLSAAHSRNQLGASMMFHRFLIGSTSSEAILEVHLIQSLPGDWADLVRIDAGIRSLRRTSQDVPPYFLVHDRSWQRAVSESERLIKRVNRFSYDSLRDFLDQHLRRTFHEHDLRILGYGQLSRAVKPASLVPVRQKAGIKSTRALRPVA